MKLIGPAILLFAIASTAARADDTRIDTRLYSPSKVVTISGKLGFQSTIEFAADEVIENIALGDSASWQVTPNKRASLLFLKPVMANATTNMTVVTSKRTYFFDLTPQRAGLSHLYALRFTYAEEIIPLSQQKTEMEEPQIDAVPSKPVDPATLNFAWVGKGEKSLLPQRSFDDGKSLFLAWHKDISLPAILVPGPDKSEGPVNYVMQGDFIVVDGVPDKVILRVGKQMAVLTNARPQANTTALATSEGE